MSSFTRELERRQTDPSGRSWVFVPYDQLNDGIGPLAALAPEEAGIVLVECPWKAARRPYHRQKLALVLANQRQFALEQAERGVAVRHLVSPGTYADALAGVAEGLGGLVMMEAAERELRADLAPLVEEGLLEIRPHEGWLTSEEDFEASQKNGPPWRMDAFYRRLRKDRGILMEDGSPCGGKYSHDAANREAWNGEPPAPEPPTFEPDEITREVGELVESRFARHPGTLDLERLPATKADADRLWDWAKASCLEHFGPYEDAMSSRSRGLFHTRISPLVNLHRLLPAEVLNDVLEMDLPLSSQEGFVRQLLGWREFVRHVHRATDGFRSLDGTEVETAARPGDGGWGTWKGSPWQGSEADRDDLDGGSLPSRLGVDEDLPAAWWGEESGLHCLDQVVADVWEEGWSHHITRLMVLSNLANLLDISPRQLTDWFWAAYVDAFDWIVEPNVLGMGTFAAGELMTTKPYVSGSGYIDRMSDYCGDCAFDPRSTCPLTPMYWAWLSRHRNRLKGNHRLRPVFANLDRRSRSRREEDRNTYRLVAERLATGEAVRPEDLASSS